MHVVAGAWHWLVVNGLNRDLVSFSVGALFASKPWLRHRKLMHSIDDRLNPETPGGITAVVDAVRSSKTDSTPQQ